MNLLEIKVPKKLKLGDLELSNTETEIRRSRIKLDNSKYLFWKLLRRRIKKYTKLYLVGTKYGVETDMEYKTDFYFYIVKLVLSTLMMFGMVEILFVNVKNINGWEKYDFYLLTAIFNICKNIFELFFYGIIEIPGDLKSGYFDRMLLRPLNLIYLYLMQGRILYYIPDILAYLFILFYALHLGAKIDLLVFVFSIVFTSIMMFSILLFVVTINFYANMSANSADLFRNIMEFGRVPTSFYSKGFKTFLTFIFPVFTTGGIIFMVQKGEIPEFLLINIAVVILAFLYFSLKFWNYSIRRYTSASS